MHKLLFVFLAFVTVSCGTLEISVQPGGTPMVAKEPTSNPTPTAEEQEPAAAPVLIPGPEITYAQIRLKVAPNQGSGVSAQAIPLVNPHDLEQLLANRPEYIQLEVIDYPAPAFHENQPFIYISSIKDYDNIEPDFWIERAAESVSELNGLLMEQPVVIDTEGFDPLPLGFPAPATVQSQVRYFRFQNGAGVRMISSHGNGFSPVSNENLAYEFYGITDDGLYYVFASFPINAPILVNSRMSNSSEIPPAGGVHFPEDLSVYPIYTQQVEEQLNMLSESDFNPRIGLLDNLLESLLVQ
jgi:hypothetical protein